MIIIFGLGCNEAVDKEEVFREAETAYHENNFELAVKLYSRILQRDDTCLKALVGRGLNYNLLQEYDSAIADYTSYINLKNDDWHVYANRASAYYNDTNYTLALKDFMSAQKLSSRFENPISHMLFATGFKDSSCYYYKIAIAKGDSTFNEEIVRYCENSLTYEQTINNEFVGTWGYEVNPSDNGERNYAYLELRSDGKGIIGHVHQFGDEKMLVRMLTYGIKYWQFKNDSMLEVNYSIMSGPAKSDFWIIEKVDNNYFTGTIYFPEYNKKSGTVTYKRMNKIERMK